MEGRVRETVGFLKGRGCRGNRRFPCMLYYRMVQYENDDDDDATDGGEANGWFRNVSISNFLFLLGVLLLLLLLL